MLPGQWGTVGFRLRTRYQPGGQCERGHSEADLHHPPRSERGAVYEWVYKGAPIRGFLEQTGCHQSGPPARRRSVKVGQREEVAAVSSPSLPEAGEEATFAISDGGKE